MTTVQPPSTQDLTTKARIRDAAIERFPRDGLKGTTVRAVASDAGVSPALVLHHFGSKEGLHEACDEHVLHSLSQLKLEAMDRGDYANARAIEASYQMMEPLIRYIAWTLTIGGGTAAHLFDEAVADLATELREGIKRGVVTEIDDVEKQAAVLAAMRLASLAFHDHLSRAFGVNVLTSEGLIEMAPYALRLFSGELFSQQVIADASQAVEELTNQKEKDT